MLEDLEQVLDAANPGLPLRVQQGGEPGRENVLVVRRHRDRSSNYRTAWKPYRLLVRGFREHRNSPLAR